MLVHSEWAAIKVGIMRENTKRLAHHRAQGWALIEQWDGLEPDSAFVAEQAVLDYWRERGIPGAVAGAEMPQGGSSETAPVDLVDLAETRRVIALALARAPIADAP